MLKIKTNRLENDHWILKSRMLIGIGKSRSFIWIILQIVKLNIYFIWSLILSEINFKTKVTLGNLDSQFHELFSGSHHWNEWVGKFLASRVWKPWTVEYMINQHWRMEFKSQGSQRQEKGIVVLFYLYHTSTVVF